MRFPRASGVLLHPTSLPGPHGSGDLGPAAHHFVDWLAAAGQTLWQVLPLGGIGPGNSPYMSSSAFAGNVLLVDLAELQQRGWLAADALAQPPAGKPARIDFATMAPYRMQKLAEAAGAFAGGASAADRAAFADFCAAQADWLDDYTLFMALCEAHGWADWCAWDEALARREPAALAAARRRHAERIGFWAFCQWCFFRQWAALRTHAHARGVKIIGDAPIFIAYQSAEVWARPDLFDLDAGGRPTVVAGVPPDYFSATGQRWGNPLYRWPAHAAEGYAWWIQRLRRTLELVDIVRIDHFRGFADYWEIPATEPTAVNGRWRPGPGLALFDAMAQALGPLPVIAEDLGQLSQTAKDLLAGSGFPGMAILQFAFAGDASDPYLPHNHHHHGVVYTGTHDNDTTVGWWASASEHERHHARAYLATDGHDIAWAMLRAACASVADTVVHPMQDILALPGEYRMNLPGSGSGWWVWRFDWQQVHGWHAQRLLEMTRLFGRAPAKA
ncbi:MAG: 4-alpha-glucanotransferase [Burkholderiaceae bacterium]|nr:4-alpha-glucanotransferase [Burkholderiaceae bacterium]